MNLPPELRCLNHHETLSEAGSNLNCASGCVVPIVDNIPRFVSSANYANAFGRQWNKFRKTQLDSHTGTTISRDRLQRCLGGSLEVIKGKSVLEVGCGAGRFTEVMLETGARVFACDLSAAVEANYANCHELSADYFVCQANALELPVAPQSFDFVVCLGVIQHTPSPEQTIAALARYVRPGGTLAIDHYPPDYPLTRSRALTRKLLLKLPPHVAHQLALTLARVLVPIHRLTWNNRRGVWRVRRWLAKHSPLVDYYGVFSITPDLLAEWAILDTHDTLTDYYKHVRTTEQIEDCLRSCGMIEVVAYYGGNGIEARAKSPASPARIDMQSVKIQL
jgi:2-polyprenyl-3-methyl-5-hydroxy-6-metoxy-1,4-benzoquinol methylase